MITAIICNNSKNNCYIRNHNHNHKKYKTKLGALSVHFFEGPSSMRFFTTKGARVLDPKPQTLNPTPGSDRTFDGSGCRD